jgi:hypothetical protein
LNITATFNRRPRIDVMPGGRWNTSLGGQSMRVFSSLVAGAVLSALAFGTACYGANLTTPTYQGSTTSGTAFDSQVSTSGDLIYRVANASYTGDSATSNPSFGYDLSNLNDGHSTDTSLTPYLTSALPTTIKYTLNTNAGTGGSALGYNISSIDSFAGDSSNGATGAQTFDLLVQTEGAPTFIDYGTYANSFNAALTANGSSAGASLTTLTPLAGSYIATNVTALEFTYSAANTVGTFIREDEVYGAASTTPAPEPASAGLLIGAGSIMALRPRRRAAR